MTAHTHDFGPALFEIDTPEQNIGTPTTTAIDYVPTPQFLAAAIIERWYSHLGPSELVLEPSCGDGSFLREIPPHVPAYGVEIDPLLAAIAKTSTGRDVICGDVLTIDLPTHPTIIIGNPPFSTAFLDRLIDRFHPILPIGGEIGFIVPAYFFQTSGRVATYSRRFSLDVAIIPRDIFPGFDIPITFARFIKDAQRRMIGLAFHREVAEWRRFPERFRAILTRAERNVWVRACLQALEQLGGRGTVEDIRRIVAGNRPTETPHWEAAIRKALQHSFERLDRGLYAIPSTN